MSKKYNIAVVGATGAVGRTMLSILDQRKLPTANLTALASERSAGSSIPTGKRSVRVQALDGFDFTDIDIALFSAGASVSREFAPIAVEAGAVVIDNSSCYRYDDDIPLVVPEVNPHALASHTGIVANPNCSTIQLVVALKPLHDAAVIERLNICTYQSVSGAGQQGIDELARQSVDLLNGRSTEASVIPSRIAFNAVPHIDVFQDNGYTKEEMKIVWETKKILEDPDILINPTAVRVPVFYGHSEAVHLETKTKLKVEDVRTLMSKASGITLMDERRDKGYPTAALDGTDTDDVFVGRIREDISHPTGLNLWIVSDNVRKGAALNSVQIAEKLIDMYPDQLRSDAIQESRRTGTN